MGIAHETAKRSAKKTKTLRQRNELNAIDKMDSMGGDGYGWLAPSKANNPKVKSRKKRH